MKKLLLLFLFSTFTYAQPNIGEPDGLSVCSDNSGISGYFDLTFNTPVLLQNLNSADFNVTYHETLTDAQNGVNPLSAPEYYYSSNTTVFARVEELNNSSNYAIADFILIVEPSPMIPLLATQFVFDNDIPSDGIAIIDLTQLDEIVLNGESADNLQITYYITAADALTASNPIANPFEYSTTSATLYIRSESLVTGCASTAPFNIVVNDFETGTPNDLNICDENNDGYTSFDLTINTEILLEGLDSNNYTVAYYEIPEDAEANVNAIPNPASYININSNVQTLYTRVTKIDEADNYALNSFTINTNPSPLSPLANLYLIDDEDNNPDDETITMSYANLMDMIEDYNGSEFEVNLYSDEANNSPLTSDFVIITSADVYYSIGNTETGCVTTGSITILVLPGDYVTTPPTGESIQSYSLDGTLADLIVEGENITWYATDGTETPPGETETSLPNDTLLIDGTTYYASQTLYGIESTERLAVQVYSILLNNADTSFEGLIHYPNPVTDVMHIKNNNTIDSLTVTNTLGQTIFTNTVNNNECVIHLSDLNSGMYFVTILSGEKSKTINIIKK
ncbi:T9SS type A sorting domain-containing protein [Flavobacterium sp. NRK1]|uniref:T9SS type A sorting domain-containing protein n=1 Tax=Flavobacterium sp. NRK1 TaxID=2954929 RepID=UPI002092B102|nr:T9SS type A sorting domain-containing protein [Flavobacterium sp. NRK1]MCO6147892.1 T9SS type A sorting domain-containing protein [Flavobacterium sp. NRK1]